MAQAHDLDSIDNEIFNKARSIDANVDELALASDQRPRRPHCTKSEFEVH